VRGIRSLVLNELRKRHSRYEHLLNNGHGALMYLKAAREAAAMVVMAFIVSPEVFVGVLLNKTTRKKPVFSGVGQVTITAEQLSQILAEARDRQSPMSAESPKIAESLLYLFLPTSDCEVIAGDLAEEYSLRLRECRPAKAKRWYWRQVFKSICTQIWVALKRLTELVAATEALEKIWHMTRGLWGG